MGGSLVVALIAALAQDAERFEERLEELLAAPDAAAAQALGEEVCQWAVEQEPRVAADLDAAPFFGALREVLIAAHGYPVYATSYAWRYALTLRDAGALSAAHRVLDRFLAQHDRDLDETDSFHPMLWIELADLERYFGNWPAVRTGLDRARELLVGDRDPFDVPVETSEPARQASVVLALWFDVRGQLAFELGLFEEAERFFGEQEARARALEEPTLVLAAVHNRMRLAYAHGELDRVERVFDEFRATPTFDATPPGELGRLEALRGRVLGELEWRGERPAGAAEELLRRSLERDVQPTVRLYAELALARLLTDQGRTTEALALVASAAERLPTPARGDAVGGDHGMLRLQWIAARARALALGEPGPAELDEIATRYRALLASWADAPIRSGGISFLHWDARRDALAQLVELRVRHAPDGVRRALADVLEAHAHGTLAREVEAAAPTLDEVLARLCGPGRGLVLYLSGRTRSHAFVLGSERIEHALLGPGHELEAARRALLAAVPAALFGGRSEALDAAGRAAGDRFLPPAVRAAIEGLDELYVVGTDAFGYVPFELLRTGGEPLGLERAIAYLPSLAVGTWLDRRRADASAEPTLDLRLAAADGLAPDDLARLRLDAFALTRDHERALTAGYAPARIAVDHGVAAGFDGALRGGARIEHLFAHGVHDPLRERPTGLVLTDAQGAARTLWPEDVEQRAVADAVWLSACGLGRTPLRRGDDGRAHWSATLWRAGASACVLSSFDVELEATVAFAARAHAELTRGASPAAALRAARLATPDGKARVQGLLTHAHGLAFEPVIRARESAPTAAGGAPERRPERSAPRLLPFALGGATLIVLLLIGLVVRRRRRQG